jgi:DnaK suppressor protein
MARKVDVALKALEDGTYGICVGCSAEIPEVRLEALPFAKDCKNCAQLAEDMAREEGNPFAAMDSQTNRGPHADTP